ncbi:MAG: multiheme c-type cytochrome [Acidobacteriota bacterium]
MKRTFLVGGLVLAVVAMWAGLATAEPTYIGAEKCKMCHKLQYDSWAQTKHAKATEDAKNAKDRKFEAACLTCHATNKSEAMAGVQCEACHGPGSEYKSISIMKDKAKAIAAGLVIPTQATCNGCHDGKDHHKEIKFDRNIVHAHKNAS